MEVSAEVHFAQTLAANEKKIRDRALKRLKKYIVARSGNNGNGTGGMSHDDYIKIWKGLHYCMWMQDKPLIQEELSHKMTDLLHVFPQLPQALKFVDVFFITEAREWTGIDKFRLDKFMMLMRDMLRETFVLLSRQDWPLSECRMFGQNLAANVTNEDKFKIPYGFKMHLAEIFLVELRKVSLDGLNGQKLTCLMFPFIYFILTTKRRELGQSMYEKTLLTACKWFGVWPWDTGKETIGDEEEDEEMDSDEENDDGSDSQEEDMEEGEEADGDKKKKYKKPKFDLRVLLRLLLRLAKDPSVESKNRSYVYGIVNSFTSRDSELLESGDDDNDEEMDVSSVYQLSGQAKEKNRISKKVNKKKRQQFEKEEAEALEMNNNLKNPLKDKSSSEKSPISSKKKKKENVNNQKIVNMADKPVSESTVKVNKKRKRTSIEPDQVVTKKLKTDDNEVQSPNESKKKNKRRSLNDETPLQEIVKNNKDNTTVNTLNSSPLLGSGKKSKASSNHSTSELDSLPQTATPTSDNKNKPSPRSRSPKNKNSTDTGVVTPTRTKKNKMFTEETNTTTTPESPTVKKVDSKKKSPSARTSPIVDTSGETARLLNEVQKAVTTPSPLKKKAVGIVTPVSKPSTPKDKTGATAEQVTPASQKKVVFNLQRNSANKFKDYLKTLANDPSPYEPTKSPGQGILKSPSIASLTSVDSTTPTGKRKGRRVSGKKSPKSPVRR